ncbi:hypothetical protein QQS21_004950 [Conoideocrella luteorostrata]|uniref:CENP-V/GFA domain-containing protein n=1 Tax=Conoideocrella luteorostrata TaxID=1105319 RepID=A0AAJ0CTD9_9HYPO|nr:hypothetical protein QQS21_004950 [Conoideocrella luteorostrata]
MSALRPLRGGCLCGRNRYIIALPEDGIQRAQVLFSTDRSHQEPLATPLAAYIRVPLAWLHSTTFAFFDDEKHAMIRRVYTHPSQEHTKRNFCGFCGTPLSYWSEEPRSEAEFINLTLGSLLQEDLRDLEELGLIPDESESEPEEKPADTPNRDVALRQSFGVPWFDGMVEGTRLGRMRRTHGIKRSEDGTVKIEWEIVEESMSPDAGNDVDMDSTSGSSGKRKLQDRDD